MNTIKQSKRIAAFQRALTKRIPRFPNDKASLQYLESKHLTDLLIIYIGWRLRYVAQRPRTVAGQPSLATDPHAAALKPNIDAFVKAVTTGDDLTPYHSLDPLTRGYTPAAEQSASITDRWADKDFMLNVMGLHHFHLGMTKEAKGHAGRTDEVLFASVSRTEFEIIGLFDHKAFQYEDDGSMTPERTRLWNVYEARQAAGALPGQLVAGGYANLGVTLSSHPTAVTQAAIRHVDIVRQIDPKLDDPQFVRTLYGDSPVPAKPKLEWNYRDLDLGLLDRSAGFFGILEKGPN